MPRPHRGPAPADPFAGLVRHPPRRTGRWPHPPPVAACPRDRLIGPSRRLARPHAGLVRLHRPARRHAPALLPVLITTCGGMSRVSSSSTKGTQVRAGPLTRCPNYSWLEPLVSSGVKGRRMEIMIESS